MRRKLLVAAASLTASLVVAEAALALLERRSGSEPVVPETIGRFDPQLGWALRPGAVAVSRRAGQPVEYRINSKGLRDDETSYEKPPGIFRIVLLGDSRAFGYGVPIEGHVSAVLEGYFRDVEVINMGVSGYGVDQELLLLQSEGLKYEPDLVIAYVDHYGDHRHLHTKRFGKRKPRFILRDGEPVLTGAPVPGRPTRGPRNALTAWLGRHSRLYRRAREAYHRLRSAEEPGSPEEPVGAGAASDEDDPTVQQELYDLGEALVVAMDEASRARGARFVLMTRIGRLHAGMQKRGILSLAINAPLENPQFALPGDLLHTNEAGNAVLAWVIAEFLRGQDLIPAHHLTP